MLSLSSDRIKSLIVATAIIFVCSCSRRAIHFEDADAGAEDDAGDIDVGCSVGLAGCPCFEGECDEGLHCSSGFCVAILDGGTDAGASDAGTSDAEVPVACDLPAYEPCATGCCPALAFTGGPIGASGRSLSLLIDAADGVTYSYSGFGTAPYVYYQTGAGTEVVALPKPGAWGSVGARATAAMDASGIPRFAYNYESLDWPDTYVTERASAGSFATISLPLGTRPMTAVAVGGGVVGVAGGRPTLTASRWGESSVWLSCPGHVDGEPSFRIDYAGNPHLLCYSASSSGATEEADLVYATRAGDGPMTAEVVDGGTSSGFLADSRLAIGPDGTPHVGYRDNTHSEIRYAHRTASGWSTTLVESFDPESPTAALPQIAIAVDARGDAHLVYAHSFGAELRYARVAARGVTVRSVVEVSAASLEAEAAFDSAGRLHILCQSTPGDEIVHLVGATLSPL